MDLQQLISNFDCSDGIVSIIAIDESGNVIFGNNCQDFEKNLSVDLKNFMKNKVLDLEISHFRCRLGKYIFYGYSESKILIVIITEIKTNPGKLKYQVDNLLNQILISL